MPVIYAIFVLDLKLVKWEKTEETVEAAPRASHDFVITSHEEVQEAQRFYLMCLLCFFVA